MIANNPIGEKFEMNGAIQNYSSLDEFIHNDNEPMSYRYIEQKLRKWLDKDDVVKVVLYYKDAISKDFSKAPDSLKLLVREAKGYLRTKLLL